MYTYRILQDPGHNRVYYNESRKLSLAELKLACGKFESPCSNIEMTEMAGVHYFSFEIENRITEYELSILSRLSFVFAIFEVKNMDDMTCLLPIAKDNYEYVDPKISSILKYPGKTNELFTRMMINVALLSSDFDYDDRIQLLDPIAGKGTTLYEGAVYGFDTYGVEIEPKSVHEVCVFFKKYLERERYKHNASKKKLYGGSIKKEAYMHEFDYARTKDEFKSDDTRKKLAIVGGNSAHSSQYFKKNSFHLIVGDLPYGVAHGNVAQKKSGSLTRSPFELLTSALPEWHKVLKPGGVLVIAWNKFVLPKEKIMTLLRDNGFKTLDESPYDEFEHMVDMSIKRDIIVAKK